MYRLAVLLLLLIKDGVLVARQHLLLARHLALPALEIARRQPLPRERCVHRRDHVVDEPEPLALPSLLRRGQLPWNLPVRVVCRVSIGARVRWEWRRVEGKDGGGV